MHALAVSSSNRPGFPTRVYVRRLMWVKGRPKSARFVEKIVSLRLCLAELHAEIFRGVHILQTLLVYILDFATLKRSGRSEFSHSALFRFD
jgi:hypothetical protein